MATTKKTNTKSDSNKALTKGKKGGASVVSPEIVGAMTGAAIGGVAGLMLANKTSRENLAVVKDKAIGAASEILDNVSVDTDGVKEDLKKNAYEASNKATEKMNKSLSKKN